MTARLSFRSMATKAPDYLNFLARRPVRSRALAPTLERAPRECDIRGLHSTLDYVSPMTFEKDWLAAQQVRAG